MRLFSLALALAGVVGAAAPAASAPIDITVNPIDGLDPNDGVRDVVGGQAVILPEFDVEEDAFRFLLSAFDEVGPPLNFVNASADRLPASGVNTIVLQNADDDNDLSTVFNAGSAANLIAGSVTEDTGGFFVYFNSALDINRLVYSNDLSSTTSDLAILAAIESPTGQGAIDALPDFRNDNFAALAENVAPIPVPATLPLLGAALGGLGVLARRSRRRA